MRFTAVVTREGDWYVARAVEVEVASQGREVEEALVTSKRPWSFTLRTRLCRRLYQRLLSPK